MLYLEMTDEQEARYDELCAREAVLQDEVSHLPVLGAVYRLAKIDEELTDIHYEVAEMLDAMIAEARR